MLRLLGLDPDPSVAPPVLGRVGDEVLHRGAQRDSVPEDGRQIGGELAFDGDPFRIEHRQ